MSKILAEYWTELKFLYVRPVKVPLGKPNLSWHVEYVNCFMAPKESIVRSPPLRVTPTPMSWAHWAKSWCKTQVFHENKKIRESDMVIDFLTFLGKCWEAFYAKNQITLIMWPMLHWNIVGWDIYAIYHNFGRLCHWNAWLSVTSWLGWGNC